MSDDCTVAVPFSHNSKIILKLNFCYAIKIIRFISNISFANALLTHKSSIRIFFKIYVMFLYVGNAKLKKNAYEKWREKKLYNVKEMNVTSEIIEE